MIRVDIEDSNGNRQTISNPVKVVYWIGLNAVRWFDVLLPGAGSVGRNYYQRGFKAYFYSGSTLELIGTVIKRSLTSDGFIRLQGIGFSEKLLKDANCPDNAWTSTNTSGVIADDGTNLLSKQPGVSKGTIADQTVNFFRSDASQNLLEGISKVCELTGQDWSIDDVNTELDISDHLGSIGSQFTLTDGLDFGDLSVEEDDAGKVEKVAVTGKGFGNNQTTGVWGNGGANAPDWDQGDPEVSVVDKSLSSDTECQERAHKEYDYLQSTRYVYRFKPSNTSLGFSLGDEITLFSALLGVDSLVRIVSFKRILTAAGEELNLQVRGTSERESAVDALKLFAKQTEAERNAQAMTQPTDDGSGNVSDSGHLHDAGDINTDSHLHGSTNLDADNHLHGSTNLEADNHLHGSDYNADNHVHGSDYDTDSITSTTNSDPAQTFVTYKDFQAFELNDSSWVTLNVGGTTMSATVSLAIFVTINIGSGSSGEFVRFRLYDGSHYYYSSNVGVFGGGIGHSSTALIILPGDHASEKIYVQAITDDSESYTVYGDINFQVLSTHTHTVPSTGVEGNSTNTAPDVLGNSTNTQPGVSGNTNSTQPGVSGNTDNQGAGTTGNSATDNASVSDSGHSH